MPDQTTTQAGDEQVRREDRATRVAALAFGVSILAGVGLLVVYLTSPDTQVEGLLLTVAFGGVALGLGVWVRVIIGPDVLVEPRDPMPSRPEDRAGFEADFDQSVGEVAPGGRRRFLFKLLGGAGASLGLALSVPLLSLGPVFDPESRRELFETGWSAGLRLMTPEGEELTPGSLAVDEIATVFPIGSDLRADSQAVLIHTRPGTLQPDTLPAPDGVVEAAPSDRGPGAGVLVAYSKICTHAGCPVGLYRARDAELICPCHQSQFRVTTGAEVLSGPTGRPLPQLPLGLDDEGYLVATGDFTSPVGPSFWNITQGQGT